MIIATKRLLHSFKFRAYIAGKRVVDLLCWGLTTHQSLWVVLCRLPEKVRLEIEEIVEAMKDGGHVYD